VKAFLLAAGEGRRLGKVTAHRPKPMLEVGGRPILEYNVRLLAQHGIRELIINLHHCPETITRHFGDGTRLGVRITYLQEPTLLGTSGAVKNAADLLRGPFLVMYGDNLTNCDLSRLIDFHNIKHGVTTIALFHRENAISSGIAELGPDDRIVRFLEKPRPDDVFSPWVNAGIMAMEPSALDYIPAGRASDFGNEVLPALLAAGQPIYGYKMTESLWWVDSPEDYKRTKREFATTFPLT